jgi:hypothetical protein
LGAVQFIEAAGSRTLRAARRANWMLKSNRAARQGLANRRHVAPVSAADRKRTVEYSAEVLGSASYAIWLQLYTSVAGSFREGWIPDNFYGLAVPPRLKAHHRHLGDYRSLGVRLLGGDALPDIAYVARGRLFDRDYRAMALTDLPRDGTLVFKADYSLQGLGVRLFGPGDSIEMKGLPDGVFQPYVDQHNELAAFCDVAVATLRLTTVIEPDGRPGLRAAFIRFARRGEDHVASATHVSVSIDLASGEMQDTGLLASWLHTDRHPDSGIKFAHRVVPGFAESVRLALEWQMRVPFTPCVGWDFAVDRNGAPVLMEWNTGHNGIKVSEATVGPCFTGLGWERLRPGYRGR